MFGAFLAMVLLQAGVADSLSLEGQRLGRYTTLFALCEPYYATDIAAGHRIADDFERRSSEAGWTSAQRVEIYAAGRDLERGELGVVLDATGVSPQQARRYLRGLLSRLKPRCQALAIEVPGSIADVEAGDRRLDAALRSYR